MYTFHMPHLILDATTVVPYITLFSEEKTKKWGNNAKISHLVCI